MAGKRATAWVQVLIVLDEAMVTCRDEVLSPLGMRAGLAPKGEGEEV